MTKRVLLMGLEPETVDFSDPDLPPGMDAAKVHAGVALALRQMTERGWAAEGLMFRPDETAVPAIEAKLAGQAYDCVVIGAGVRLPRGNLLLLEQVINAVHRSAPGAAIAFNTIPQDSADAAGRWLG